jgi:tetratricopeptide (TPR) repeat protein
MKRFLSFLLSLWLLTPCVFGQTVDSFVSPTAEKLAELEKLHAKAEELVIENKFKQALEVYSEILLLEPDDETAYANSGHVQMILGNFDEAQECFWNALDINPDNLTALEGLKQIEDPDYLQKPKKDIPAPAPEPPVISEPLPTAVKPSAPPVPADTAIPSATPKPSLSREQQIQTALKNAGLYHGVVDGKIGPVSLRAIKTFQKFRGLEVDGKVGPKTWKALEPYLKIKQES